MESIIGIMDYGDIESLQQPVGELVLAIGQHDLRLGCALQAYVCRAYGQEALKRPAIELMGDLDKDAPALAHALEGTAIGLDAAAARVAAKGRAKGTRRFKRAVEKTRKAPAEGQARAAPMRDAIVAVLRHRGEPMTTTQIAAELPTAGYDAGDASTRVLATRVHAAFSRYRKMFTYHGRAVGWSLAEPVTPNEE